MEEPQLGAMAERLWEEPQLGVMAERLMEEPQLGAMAERLMEEPQLGAMAEWLMELALEMLLAWEFRCQQVWEIVSVPGEWQGLTSAW